MIFKQPIRLIKGEWVIFNQYSNIRLNLYLVKGLSFIKKMIDEYKNKFPKWCDKKENYSLALTDDIDSLFSCLMLQKLKGYKIEWFYDFENLYKIQDANNKAIGVDMDCCGGKVWSNHLTMIKKDDYFNPDAANINIIDGNHQKSYFNKFSGSTLIQILSYYDYDISSLPLEAKMVLMCVDSYYIPFHVKKIDFRPKQYKYLRILEYEELGKIAEKHSENEFEELIKKYKLKEKIRIDKKSGKLETNINLEGLKKLFNLPFLLPDNVFTPIKTFKKVPISLTNNNFTLSKENVKNKKIFSLAITNKNFMIANIM